MHASDLVIWHIREQDLTSSMGSATLTRSQSRKTRSICNLDVSEKGLSSPFVVLPGNHVKSSSRIHTRNTASGFKFIDKENAPPYPSRLTDGGGSERKGLAKSSPQKVLKKRKQSEHVCKGLGRSSATSVVEATLETPVTLECELTRPRPDAQVAENPSESQVNTRVELFSGNGLSLAEQSCNPCEGQTEISARKSARCFTEDEGKDIATRQKKNDAGAGAVLSSSSALALLQKDYERLFSKYKKLKAQRLDEADTLYNEQNLRITDFVQATEALLEFYKGENLSLKQQIEVANSSELLERCKSLEKANVDCRSALLQEQSKGLELRQENQRLKSLLLEHIAEKHKQTTAEPLPVQGSQSRDSTDVTREVKNESMSNGRAKLVQRLLECVLGLQLSCPDGESDFHLHFQHHLTGFSFDIKEVHDEEIAELVEGGELLYQNVSVGVCKKAVEWMKEKELIFGMNQAQMLLKRLVSFLNRGFF